MKKIERALISVSEKAGIVSFARKLSEWGVEILSTGGTASLLRKNNIDVVEVSDYTGFPEMMDGRVKTLHPKIHAGILAQRNKDSHLDDMKSQDIPPIDLVVVNLYPFENTIKKRDCSIEDAIENIDIGGPTMLRAAAKNHEHITVIVNSDDYQRVLKDMSDNDGTTNDKLRFDLAKKVFAHTAKYDGAIATYLARINKDGEDDRFGNYYGPSWIKRQDMRYGENPHQAAAFYSEPELHKGTVAVAKQLQGKPLSFNNIADSDAALECVKAFEEPACVIVKHANPCGAAVASDIGQAYERAFATDPTSAFGGIIAFNRPLDETTANTIVERQFVEVIIAPVVEDAVVKVIASKPNVRVLETGAWDAAVSGGLDYKRVVGGLLVQERDTGYLTREQIKTVSKREPTQQELADLLFSWNVVKFVKSNAIVYCREGQTIGIGAGQMSRVYSARIAAIKAQDENLQVKGSVMASDAFFPFRDGIDQAAEAGITAVIQPGGSMRDDEVIAAADEHGMAMVFTGMRHFRH